MKVHTAKAVGETIRKTRKSAGLTQRDLANACGCGVRFVSDLENGKPTVELEKTIRVLNVLSLDIDICERSFL